MIKVYAHIIEGKWLEDECLERQVFINGQPSNMTYRGYVYLDNDIARVTSGLDVIDIVISKEYTQDSLETHKGYKHALQQKRKVYPRSANKSNAWLSGFALGWYKKAQTNA